MSADQVDDTPQPAAIPLRFIDAAGNAHDVVAQPGDSLMAVATQHLIEGIGGDCGGCCACGTCRVCITATPLEALPEAGDEERDLLAFCSDEVTADTRLGCQVPVSVDMAGAVIVVDPAT